MLKAADHLEKVKKQKVSEKDLAHLRPQYEVCEFTFSLQTFSMT
jgi:hypothetical protein